MPINIQPIEKRRIGDGSVLDTHSIFYTIQGEGPYSGHPAVFIRLAGCNLQCPGCDTDYTSDRQNMAYQNIVHKANLLTPYRIGKGRKLVVITGGEPFRQNITPLVKYLMEYGFHVQIETNGTLPPSPDLPDDVVIVCSPKTGRVSPDLQPRINAYKYVLAADAVHDADGLPTFALGHSASPRVARPHADFNGPVYLQPMDAQDLTTNQANLEAVKASCLKQGFMLQLQIHKLISVE